MPSLEPDALVELVVASFAASPPPDPPRAADAGTLAHLREAFVAAGAAHLRALCVAERWLQVGVSFADADQVERFLAETDLAAAVDAWRADGVLLSFFFMRKPPGLRLRFALAPDRSDVGEAKVRAWLDRAHEDGLLLGWERGVYDAETHQFGGPTGLSVFHRWSVADSLAALRFEALEALGRATVDRTVLSLLAVTGLVACVAEDPWEQWDVWSELGLTGRLVAPDSEAAALLREDLEDNRALIEAVLHRRGEVLADLIDEERALVAAWDDASAAAAAELRAAARAGQLGCGPRKIVPFFVIFHWNRLGLDLDQQLALTFFLWALLDPKRAAP